jgi:uncharacterized protein (UPF0276 family)
MDRKHMPDGAPRTVANPGFGLGLRTAHYADFLAEPQPLDWLEIITDNFLVEGGKPLVMLERLRRDYPVAMHGVAMSLGAPGGPDLAYLRRVKALADRVQPLWVSDHLCWIGPGPELLHDLYPLPYTDEAARHVVQGIRRAQDVLGRRLVLENVSSYIAFRDSAASEWQFLSHVAHEADCLLLVDINNIHVSSVNHRFNPLDYLDGLPAQRVQQFHLAGHEDHGDTLIDTHDHPVAPPVWELYRQACLRFGAVATMIERDDHIPPLQELLDELAVARGIARGCAVGATQAGPPDTHVPRQPHEPLEQLQQALSRYILAPAQARGADAARRVRTAPGVDARQRLGIYHHAYRARLAEVLAESFEKTRLFMGSETFAQEASMFAVEQPPRVRNLGRYGAGLPAFFGQRYPGNPELRELAQLDWDLRECFDGPDVAALDAQAAAADPRQAWLLREQVLHPSVRLRPVTTNVLQLWNAINGDEEVPAAAALDEPGALLVWRKGHLPHFQSVEPAQAQFLEALAQGRSITQACEDLQGLPELAQPQTLGQWLGEWWEQGWLRAQSPAEVETGRATGLASLTS